MFLVTFIMFKHVKVGKYIEHMRQNLSKDMLIVKFHPGMKYLHMSFFFPPRDQILTGMSSSQVEISSRRKRVNSLRQFTIDRDDFIPA